MHLCYVDLINMLCKPQCCGGLRVSGYEFHWLMFGSMEINILPIATDFQLILLDHGTYEFARNSFLNHSLCMNLYEFTLVWKWDH